MVVHGVLHRAVHGQSVSVALRGAVRQGRRGDTLAGAALRDAVRPGAVPAVARAQRRARGRRGAPRAAAVGALRRRREVLRARFGRRVPLLHAADRLGHNVPQGPGHRAERVPENVQGAGAAGLGGGAPRRRRRHQARPPGNTRRRAAAPGRGVPVPLRAGDRRARVRRFPLFVNSIFSGGKRPHAAFLAALRAARDHRTVRGAHPAGPGARLGAVRAQARPGLVPRHQGARARRDFAEHYISDRTR